MFWLTVFRFNIFKLKYFQPSSDNIKERKGARRYFENIEGKIIFHFFKSFWWGYYKSILEFEIFSPCRIATAASKLLKYHSVSTESQQNLQNDIFKDKIVIVVGCCQLWKTITLSLCAKCENLPTKIAYHKYYLVAKWAKFRKKCHFGKPHCLPQQAKIYVFEIILNRVAVKGLNA